MGDWTPGTVPTILAGDVPTGDDWDTVLDILTAATGAWTTWSPTLTNLTLGNGTVTAVYRRLGMTLDYSFKFVLGNTSAVGTAPQITLPYAPASRYGAIQDEMGTGILLDAGTANRAATVFFSSGSTVQILSYSTTGVVTTITSTVPWVWTTSDCLAVHGTVELA